MRQPAIRPDVPQLFHVNFHTMQNRPVFEVPGYRALLERAVNDTLARWEIPCLTWQVMPTHLHFILVSFADRPLGKVLNLIKGSVAHTVLLAAPELRADLGDHLWQEGYDWVEIKTYRQCANTVRHVRENRTHAGLED